MAQGTRSDGNLEHSPIDVHFERVGVDAPCGGGTLFKAREKSSGKVVGIQRPVAEADAQEHFVEAARKVKRLWHTHLLRLYVVAKDDSGPYVAIEWCENGSLAERLERGALPEDEVWALARSIALALEYSHQQGIAHGGLRPTSVLLGNASSWKIGGFGSFALGAPTRAADQAVYGEDTYPRGLGAEAVDLVAFGRLIGHAATGVAAIQPNVGSLKPALQDLILRASDSDHAKRFASIEEVVRSIHEGSTGGTLIDRFDRRGPGLPSQRGPTRISTPGAANDGVTRRDGADARTEPDTVRGREGRGVTKPGSIPQSTATAGAGTTRRRGTSQSSLPYEPMEGRYEPIGDRLEGGMGYVVKCKETSTGRVVAVKRVKVIPGQDEVLMQRFLREASNIARLSHPHVLTLFRAARDDDGDYIVLEWADSGSLKDRLDTFGKLPLAEVADVARKIGGALGYAHSKGVIHRDIKPHNILLMHDQTPKLADFGLARGTGDMTITRSTGGAGTPIYMAPEQWISARDADGRSDLCSFGKVIYHLATGESPVKLIMSKLPLELRSTVATLVKDRREDRFQTAEQFLAHMERSISRVRLLKRVALFAVILLVLIAVILLVPAHAAPFLKPIQDALRGLVAR